MNQLSCPCPSSEKTKKCPRNISSSSVCDGRAADMQLNSLKIHVKRLYPHESM